MAGPVVRDVRPSGDELFREYTCPRCGRQGRRNLYEYDNHVKACDGRART
jgi:hypothetical protein